MSRGNYPRFAKILATWLLIGLALGVLGGLETLVTTEGDVGLGLMVVALGLVIGLVTGLLYAVVHRDEVLPQQGESRMRRKVLLVAVGTSLLMAASIVRVSDGPVLFRAVLIGLAAIPLVALLRLRK